MRAAYLGAASLAVLRDYRSSQGRPKGTGGPVKARSSHQLRGRQKVRESPGEKRSPQRSSLTKKALSPTKSQPLAPGQRLERGERRAEVRAPLVPLVGRVVGHDPAERRRHVAVVYRHHHSRLHHGERFPKVIVVAIDVDGEEIDGAGGAGAANDLIDVLAREEAPHAAETPRFDRRWMIPKLGLVHLLVAFEPDSAPALAQEVGGVVLQAVAGAELHEAAVLFADTPEDLREDPVGVVLGQRAESVELEPLGIDAGDLLQLPIELGTSEQWLEPVEGRAHLRLDAREPVSGARNGGEASPGLAKLPRKAHGIDASSIMHRSCQSGWNKVNPPITLKRSVTESEGVASKPVLPPPPERGPRDGARTSGVCRGNARAVSASDETRAERAVG